MLMLPLVRHWRGIRRVKYMDKKTTCLHSFGELTLYSASHWFSWVKILAFIASGIVLIRELWLPRG